MPKTIDIIMPSSDEGTESVLERWFKQPGDSVKEHEPIIEINTDKVTLEVPAPATGTLSEILIADGTPVQAGDILGRISLEKHAESVEPAAKTAEVSEPSEKSELPYFATMRNLSPPVRRLLKRHRLDPNLIDGSGRGGRVTLRDVENYISVNLDGVALKPSAASPQQPADTDGESYRVPHSGTRRRTAAHMVQSMLQTAPHVTAVWNADLSAVSAHRQANKSEFARQGVKLTFTAYFVDAAIKAIAAVPEVNSQWFDDGLEIYNYVNIGIAAATDKGLIVPVIHQAQSLNLFGIAQKLQDVTERARIDKLKQADVKGGTFTITNHGMSGSLIATPIINQPQSAILGIGKMEKRVVVVETESGDATQIKPMAYVTLTIDHRVLDGFQANQFLQRFVDALAEW